MYQVKDKSLIRGVAFPLAPLKINCHSEFSSESQSERSIGPSKASDSEYRRLRPNEVSDSDVSLGDVLLGERR